MNHLDSCVYFSPKHALTFVEGLSGALKFKPYGNLVIASEQPFEVCFDGRRMEHRCFILEDNRAMDLTLRGSQIATLTLDVSEMETMIARHDIERHEGYSLVNDESIADALLAIRSQQQDINMANWNVLRLIYRDDPIQLFDVDKRLVKAVAWMYANIANTLVLAEVAQQVHLSESRLADVFKNKLGTTFNRIKLSLRFSYFLERYAESNDLTASCLDAGFHDLSHFYKTYRLAFGMAPSLIFDNDHPPELIYDPSTTMVDYGQWLANEFYELVSDKDDVSIMELIATFA